MTTKPSSSRPGFIRQDRAPRKNTSSRDSKITSSTRRTYNSRTMYLPTEPRLRRDPQPARKTRQSATAARNPHYDLSFNLGRTAVSAPAINLPVIDLSNPRLVSGALTLVLAALLIMLWTASAFSVSSVQVSGNLRVDPGEISLRSGIVGEPIFKAVPDQIEANLRSAFPELKAVSVKIGFPDRIKVEVVERTPVIAWFQNDATTWIDSEGIAFIPRGDASGLVLVTSSGSPTEVIVDPELPFYEQRFINPEVVQAIIDLAPSIPEGMLLIYDPEYGIGWQDPRGWIVQIGQNTRNLPMKLTIYQTLVERLVAQGIQPSMISMEYMDAPFYK